MGSVSDNSIMDGTNKVHIAMIDLMPIEILIIIFGYLSTGELLKNVALVCKKFYNVTKTPHAHKRVSLIFRQCMSSSYDTIIITRMI